MSDVIEPHREYTNGALFANCNSLGMDVVDGDNSADAGGVSDVTEKNCQVASMPVEPSTGIDDILETRCLNEANKVLINLLKIVAMHGCIPDSSTPLQLLPVFLPLHLMELVHMHCNTDLYANGAPRAPGMSRQCCQS